MYLPALSVASATSWGWFHRLVAHVVEVADVLWRWLTDNFCSMAVRLGEIFTQPSQWMVLAFYAVVNFVHAHIFFVHILAWSIFFGPIVVLVPFLLVHEIFILAAFNLAYAFHGLSPGSLPDKYEALRLSLLDTRESLFSFVDRSSSLFNKWTTEHTTLMSLRLAGGVLGTVLLYTIWAGL